MGEQTLLRGLRPGFCRKKRRNIGPSGTTLERGNRVEQETGFGISALGPGDGGVETIKLVLGIFPSL